MRKEETPAVNLHWFRSYRVSEDPVRFSHHEGEETEKKTSLDMISLISRVDVRFSRDDKWSFFLTQTNNRFFSSPHRRSCQLSKCKLRVLIWRMKDANDVSVGRDNMPSINWSIRTRLEIGTRRDFPLDSLSEKNFTRAMEEKQLTTVRLSAVRSDTGSVLAPLRLPAEEKISEVRFDSTRFSLMR